MDAPDIEPEVFGEVMFLGGVCPRSPAPFADSDAVFVSDQGRPCGAGLLDNSRRKALPTLKDRLLARVPSLSRR